MYGACMNKPNTFRDMIENWGGIPAFAEDIGVGYVTAQKMWQRNSVAVRHWPVLLQKATGRDVFLTSDRLLEMKAKSQVAA